MMHVARFLVRPVLCAATLLVFAVTSAQAVVVQYNAELRFGFGSGGNPTSTTTRPTKTDTANNAVPPCAATNVTPTHGTMGGTSATEAVVNFVGIADVLTPTAAVPSVKFFRRTHALGLFTSCPRFTNGVPGGALFERTQRATFSWPLASGTVSAGGGPGLPGPTGRQAVIPWGSAGQQGMAAIEGVNRYGGALAMNGAGDPHLGLNTPGGGKLSVSLPIPVQLGDVGATQPTLIINRHSDIRVHIAHPTSVPHTVGMNGPVAIPNGAFASGAVMPWTTGTVTAYDTIGDFLSTRTRVGNVSFTGTGMGVLQMVTPAVLKLGIPGVPLGIALTGDMKVTFVPEPAATAMLLSGVALLGGFYLRRRR